MGINELVKLVVGDRKLFECKLVWFGYFNLYMKEVLKVSLVLFL